MDTARAAAVNYFSANGPIGTRLIECVVALVVVAAVLRLEVTRRAPDLPRPDLARRGYGAGCKSLLLQWAPEAAGLIALLTLSLNLRFLGSTDGGAEVEKWAEIIKQWPILLGADTLLALQAMLRVLVFASSALRMRNHRTPLSHEAAALHCGAAIGRAVLAVRSSVYMLDGPLGGNLPVACELISVPLLAWLSRGICRRALITSISTLLVTAWVAIGNRLALADDMLLDGLFIYVHLTELVAAFAFLFRALLSDVGVVGSGRGGVALHFSHIVMPLQQCFAAYYFVQAFDYVPELVAVGHPFHILQAGGVAQLGAYAGAAVLHWAEHFEPLAEHAGYQREESGNGSPPSMDLRDVAQSARGAPRHAAVSGIVL